MLALGIVLVVAAVGLVLAALFGGSTQTANFDLGAVQGEASTFAVFLAGALTLLLLLAGLALINAGLRRARKRRQDKKELHRLSEKVAAQEEAAAPTTTSTEGGTPTDGDTRTDRAAPTDSTRRAEADTTVTDQDRSKG
jgi:uncharacterized membrane protein